MRNVLKAHPARGFMNQNQLLACEPAVPWCYGGSSRNECFKALAFAKASWSQRAFGENPSWWSWPWKAKTTTKCFLQWNIWKEIGTIFSSQICCPNDLRTQCSCSSKSAFPSCAQSFATTLGRRQCPKCTTEATTFGLSKPCNSITCWTPPCKRLWRTWALCPQLTGSGLRYESNVLPRFRDAGCFVAYLCLSVLVQLEMGGIKEERAPQTQAAKIGIRDSKGFTSKIRFLTEHGKICMIWIYDARQKAKKVNMKNHCAPRDLAPGLPLKVLELRICRSLWVCFTCDEPLKMQNATLRLDISFHIPSGMFRSRWSTKWLRPNPWGRPI